MSEQERLEAMLETLRLLWPKGYGSFPFKIGEAPSRVFHESQGEEGEEFVYGIVYRDSVMTWNEGIEELSLLPKGKRWLVNGWMLERLHVVPGDPGEREDSLEWDEPVFIRTGASAAVEFTSHALKERMYEALMERGLV